MKRNYTILILLLLLCCSSVGAQGVKVTGSIVPNALTDGYPTHTDIYGKGGFMSVPDVATRNAINALRRKAGMLVYVTADDVLYQLKGGEANSNWVAVPLGTGGGSFTWGGSGTAPATPTTNTVYYNTTDQKTYIWNGTVWEVLAQGGGGAMLSWQGSLATAPSSPTLNMAYYSTTDKRSYVWDGDSWEILSQDGATGAQGLQGIQGLQGPAGTNGVSLSWQGSLASAPGSPTLNMAYYNTTDKRSYVWDGDSWEILSQDGSDGATGSQGPQGIQGLQGPAGTNGVSLSWQGSLGSAPVSPTLNMAYYNTTDKRSYVWDGDSWEILSQDGSDGAQGIQGPAGTNGVSLSWQGSLASAPGSPTLNMAYYNTTDKRSYVWDGDSWEVLSQDGAAGVNGIGVTWRGDLAAHPTDQSLNHAYYNTTDKKSYIWDGDSWETMAQDGSASLNFNGNRPITLGLSPFNGVNPSTNDLAAWIEHVFYPSQGPTAGLTMSFVNPETGSTVTGTSTTQEMMAAGSNISVTLNWTAGRQASTATLATVTVGGASPIFSQPAQSASTNGSTTVSLTRNNNTTYTNLVSTTDSKNASASVSINFSWRRYYGFMTAPGGVSNGTGFTPSNSEILSLSNNGFGSSRGFTSSSLTPSGSQRMIIAYPLAWDPGPSTSAQIWVGGLESSSGFQRQVVSFTNASGGVTDYVVYVQLNNTSGNILFTIQ